MNILVEYNNTKKKPY